MEFSSSEVSIVLETQFPTIKGGDISPLPSFESMISSLENTRPRFLKTISSLDWTSTLRFSRLFEAKEIGHNDVEEWEKLEFPTLDDAQWFYNDYAVSHGFNTRIESQ
ncbi:hypothetical protein LINPERHAP1_LOCUS21480, partial [Linum perenne]